MTTARNSIRRPEIERKPLRCWVCGSTEQVQVHHPAGQNHVRWLKFPPLCRIHHDKVTTALRLGRVDMRYTSDRKERFRRMLQALLVFQWLILEWYSEGE
jgi:hypothetical protein